MKKCKYWKYPVLLHVKHEEVRSSGRGWLKKNVFKEMKLLIFHNMRSHKILGKLSLISCKFSVGNQAIE